MLLFFSIRYFDGVGRKKTKICRADTFPARANAKGCNMSPRARALRIIFPEKPFNPALIRITGCNQTGCECMVCTSNPSLMKGLSCPELGRPFAGQVERLSYKHLFLHPPREAHLEHHYSQDSFHYSQDNFSAHIR